MEISSFITKYPMIIPNHKTIYENVGKKMDIDPSIVEAVGQFTWGDLNERISTFANREIYMLKLGTFKFRKVKGENCLKGLKKSIAIVNNNPTYTEEEREMYIGNILRKINGIEKLVEEWNQIIKERKEFKDEQSRRDIQKQELDLGRVEEQSI